MPESCQELSGILYVFVSVLLPPNSVTLFWNGRRCTCCCRACAPLPDGVVQGRGTFAHGGVSPEILFTETVIGQAVGKIAQAFGMRLLVTARHEKPVPEGAEFVTLDELLSRADVVSLHCPQTAENLHMIGAAALAKMKDGAILLNTARGGLIDEQAVADALKRGKLAGYGADVVSKEPIAADNPLLTAPNCYLTPHIAWAPKEARLRLHHIAAENLRAFLDGTPQNVVNP